MGKCVDRWVGGSTISALSLKLSPLKVVVMVADGMSVGPSICLAQSKHQAHAPFLLSLVIPSLAVGQPLCAEGRRQRPLESLMHPWPETLICSQRDLWLLLAVPQFLQIHSVTGLFLEIGGCVAWSFVPAELTSTSSDAAIVPPG